MESLGRRLLQRLRGAGGREAQVVSAPPPVPNRNDLEGAEEHVRRGGVRAAESFLEMLVAADAAGEDHRAVARSLLAEAEPKVWLALDLASRRSWWALPSWWRAAVDNAAGGDSVLGLVIASFHPDGHVREAAVARLSEFDDPLTGPALAVRSTDWVLQVRDRAQVALERRMEQSFTGTAQSVGPIALLIARRRAGSWLAHEITERLGGVSDDQLRLVLASRDRLMRRAAWAAAVAGGRLTLEELLDCASTEDDLPTRMTCAIAAIDAARAEQRLVEVAPLLSNPSARIRQLAIQALSDVDGHVAVKALADTARSVRDVAQRIVREQGLDPADSHREAVAGANPPSWAIAGLGETGSKEDVRLLTAALQAERSRVRAEAVRALRRLGAADPQVLVPFLTDGSGAVTKQAAHALESGAAQLDIEMLRRLLGPEQPRHVRVAGCRLLHAHSPWTRLLVDLELLADADERLRTRALVDILGWLKQEAASTYAQPPSQSAADLARLLEARRDVLGRQNVETLRFHLGLRP